MLRSSPGDRRGILSSSVRKDCATRARSVARICWWIVLVTTGHHQAIGLNSFEDRPNVSMLDYYGISEPLSI